MKKYITIFISIIVIGILLLLLPYLLTASKQSKEVNKFSNHKLNIQNISSNLMINNDTETTTITESEIYNEEQIYFLNIEALFEYLNISQIEAIKFKIQSYIHQNIDKNILDCTLKTDTIGILENNILFELTINNVKSFKVDVLMDDNNGVIDITIIHSL